MEDRCVVCGEIVPEGIQVCNACMIRQERIGLVTMHGKKYCGRCGKRVEKNEYSYYCKKCGSVYDLIWQKER